MKKNEKNRVEHLSSWYIDEQLDFDKCLIKFRYETIRPYLFGTIGLELGPADGQMTKFLVKDFDKLTIVDGSAELLSKIPDRSNLIKVHSMFEQFSPSDVFSCIILEHILEHVENPIYLMQKAKSWLEPCGNIILGVPNANSIHRLAAVKMGLLESPDQLNARDHALGHRRVYTPESFKHDIEQSGLRIIDWGGVFFKPLSNAQIQENWSEEMIRGFYELGKDFPEYAAEIFAICQF